MAIEHYVKIDTSATPDEVKSVLLSAVPLDDLPDWQHIRNAGSVATGVTLQECAASDTAERGTMTCVSVCFRSRDYDRLEQFDEEAVGGIIALLTRFPEADITANAYVDVPALLRRNGRLVLAAELAVGDEIWSETRPYRRMFDMHYAIEPLASPEDAGTSRRIHASTE